MTSTEEEVKAEARARMLRHFESWLDSVLTEEPPPEGLPAGLLAALKDGETVPAREAQTDLYSLWSAMTGLTQEVKIQSRTFRQLYDTLATKLDATAGDAAAAPKKSPLDLLLDLHDRLQRGLDTAREARLVVAPRRSLLYRWLGGDRREFRQMQDTLQALDRGYELTLHRLDQALEDLHLYPIRCMGEMFDPHRMTAMELQETDDVPEGTVVGIYSDGYEWNGQMYRAAQVKVARAINKKEGDLR
jgi:molecular chaperone GrpE